MTRKPYSPKVYSRFITAAELLLVIQTFLVISSVIYVSTSTSQAPILSTNNRAYCSWQGHRRAGKTNDIVTRQHKSQCLSWSHIPSQVSDYDVIDICSSWSCSSRNTLYFVYATLYDNRDPVSRRVSTFVYYCYYNFFSLHRFPEAVTCMVSRASSFINELNLSSVRKDFKPEKKT